MGKHELEPCVPVPMKYKFFQDLVAKTKDWAIMHGVGMRSRTNFNMDQITFLPFTLIPTSFPKEEFKKAESIQTTLNEVIHKVAYDREFLSEVLHSTVEVDEFTRRLFQVYETVQSEGPAQKLSLGLFRGDYLVDTLAKKSIKQVEFNTVSVSFGGAGPVVTDLHRFVLSTIGEKELANQLPDNFALAGLCQGLYDAWKIYGQRTAAIMFVVEDVSYNICDQRFHEFELGRLNPEVLVIRRTLTQIFQRSHLNDKKELFIDDVEIAVIYFRTGYVPSQFKGENDWEALLLMERSMAIKCPSVHYHLAGSKKVQQALTRPKVLEKYLTDQRKVEMVREIFTNIYSLEFDAIGNEAVELALRNPEKYVLKPQREGGGHNIYGADVKRKMEEMANSQERTAWILMSRIVPPVQKNYIIRPGVEVRAEEPQEVVSELGIFGVILGDSKEIYVNRQVGHMLRTKLSTADEGGVAAGVGCLDSPVLVS